MGFYDFEQNRRIYWKAILFSKIYESLYIFQVQKNVFLFFILFIFFSGADLVNFLVNKFDEYSLFGIYCNYLYDGYCRERRNIFFLLLN